MTKAKDIIIDFINFAFLIAVSVYIFFYIVTGGNLSIFTDFFQMLMPIALFSFPFLIITKLNRQKIKKFDKENNLDEPVAYIAQADKIRHIIVILIVAIVIILIAVIDGYMIFSDFIQALTVLLFLLIWHYILFYRDGNKVTVIYLTYYDKIKDEVVSFLLPLVVLSTPLLSKNIDNVDFLQALSAFFIYYIWHFLMLRKNV